MFFKADASYGRPYMLQYCNFLSMCELNIRFNIGNVIPNSILIHTVIQ